jgi:hypothetical protein
MQQNIQYSSIIEIQYEFKTIAELLMDSKLLFKINSFYPNEFIDYINQTNNIDNIDNLFYEEKYDIGEILFSHKIENDFKYFNGLIPLNASLKYIKNTKELNVLKKHLLNNFDISLHSLIKNKNIWINFNLI